MKHSLKEDEYVTVIKRRKETKQAQRNSRNQRTSLTLPFVEGAGMQRSIATLATNVTAAEVTLQLRNN